MNHFDDVDDDPTDYESRTVRVCWNCQRDLMGGEWSLCDDCLSDDEGDAPDDTRPTAPESP